MSDVRDNPANNRFEMRIGDEVAAAYYSRSPGLITFTHTEVPQALSGQGNGSRLARGALEIVKSEGIKVVAKCPFISAFISKHPEFSGLL
jgi:uncharacterized protein